MEAQYKRILTKDHELLLRQQIRDLKKQIGTKKNCLGDPKINLLFEKLINLLKILRKDVFNRDAASQLDEIFMGQKFMIDNFMTQKQVSQLELVRQQILSHNYFIMTCNMFKNFQTLAAQSKVTIFKQTLKANIYGLLSIIRPTSEYMQKLDETKCLLQRVIDSSEQLKHQYGEILVAMYGSSVNGLALMNSSDLDLTLIVTSGEKVDHMELLEQVYVLLGTNKRCSHSQILPIKRLQLLKFRDQLTSLSVDVTVNAICQIYNSQMVATYARIDSRFLDLALVLKHWNSTLFKEANLKLNSYSLVLMLIAFLQEKGILPNIHILGSGQKKLARYELQYYANIYAKNLRLIVQPNEANVAFETDIQNIEDSFIPAGQSLETEDLLLEFFNFYLYNFKLGEQVIQVDGLTPFVPYNFNAHTQFQSDDSFKIADPFQPNYNPAKVIRMGSDLERQYQKAMVLTLFNLLEHGQMFKKSGSM